MIDLTAVTAVSRLINTFSSLSSRTISNILLVLKIAILLLRFRKSLEERWSECFIRPILYVRISLQLSRMPRSFERNFRRAISKTALCFNLGYIFFYRWFWILFTIDFQCLPFEANSNSFKSFNFDPSVSFLSVPFLTSLLSLFVYQFTLSMSLRCELFYRIFSTSLGQQQFKRWLHQASCDSAEIVVIPSLA